MEQNLIITMILLFIIILISLVFDALAGITEGFQQGFSEEFMKSMKPCMPDTSGCIYVKWYDNMGNLQNGNYSALSPILYLNESGILQRVPEGNIATADHRGYVPRQDQASATNQNLDYANLAHLTEDTITPITCDIKNTSAYYPNTDVVCADISYGINNGSYNKLMHGTIIIPDGFYNNNGIVKKIPYGYVTGRDKNGIIPNLDMSNQLLKTKYDSNNYDTTYHPDPTSEMPDSSSAGLGKMWILDQSGKLIAVPYTDVSGTTLYNEPGSFRFGSSNYVPNYEESVYLSKLTNISTVTPVTDAIMAGSGFCSSLYPDKNALEEKCNSLDKSTCGSTSCCTLLGGEKCVYGSERGPYFKANYSNFLIKNPEFYYYQGKCYGKCDYS